MQLSFLPSKINQNDVVYTPDAVARDIVNYFNPSGMCLDPCLGDGAFYKYLPSGREWCEIEKGRDFFFWSKPVDWIVGNPPYSIFSDWLRHSMELAPNIVYLIPIAKVYSVEGRMKEIYQWGGIVETVYYGKGTELGFPFGFPAGAVYIRRGFGGPIKVSFRQVPLTNRS